MCRALSNEIIYISKKTMPMLWTTRYLTACVIGVKGNHYCWVPSEKEPRANEGWSRVTYVKKKSSSQSSELPHKVWRLSIHVTPDRGQSMLVPRQERGWRVQPFKSSGRVSCVEWNQYGQVETQTLLEANKTTLVNLKKVSTLWNVNISTKYKIWSVGCVSVVKIRS